ncbi:Minor histocompatibility antigen H13 [Portunus trituberculatus]|uniref:Minor histocompatibility antigen H13 n=1 Tax=Portunus trituberculatus TaxID=210409 RepID=A0A5B7CN24_PORTR|nr:Minor histocompatibility antigen H13 [Portunus trituberculatus]
MADVEEATAPGLENVTQGSFNDSQAAVNGTGKVPSTPEGMALAYGSLVMMALVPIVCGAFRSVKHQQQQKVTAADSSHLSPGLGHALAIPRGALFMLHTPLHFPVPSRPGTALVRAPLSARRCVMRVLRCCRPGER